MISAKMMPNKMLFRITRLLSCHASHQLCMQKLWLRHWVHLGGMFWVLPVFFMCWHHSFGNQPAPYDCFDPNDSGRGRNQRYFFTCHYVVVLLFAAACWPAQTWLLASFWTILQGCSCFRTMRIGWSVVQARASGPATNRVLQVLRFDRWFSLNFWSHWMFLLSEISFSLISQLPGYVQLPSVR